MIKYSKANKQLTRILSKKVQLTKQKQKSLATKQNKKNHIKGGWLLWKPQQTTTQQQPILRRKKL